MSRRILELSTCAWEFGQVARRPFGPSPVDDRGAAREWLTARVPGNVRADLIAARRIPPVETPEGIAAGNWVDDNDWWYRVKLAAGYAAGEIVILEADGIDYLSAIWLDDHLLATHAGMFARQTVALSPWVNEPGPHELAIRIWGGGALPKLADPPLRRLARGLVQRFSPGVEYFPDRMAIPKAQFSFGWDFSPRLLSAGIWDDLRLVVTRDAYIEDLWVQPEPLTERDDPTPVRWHLRLRVAYSQREPLYAEVAVEPENSATHGEVTGRGPTWMGAENKNATGQRSSAVLRVPPLEAQPRLCALEVESPSIRRWWPWDQGEPCLYRVTVRLSDERGPLDEISRVVGVRTVQRTALPGGAPWRFVFNGRPVFLRGANWVPADVLPGRVRDSDYERLLDQARGAGINFLRVWGGGVREKRAFWEGCDRLGIAAWQELPLACAFLDHYPRDRAYLDVLAGEARDIVRALRNHASLIAWCGGNEINPAREKSPLGAIVQVLRDEDPGRPWIPVSPSDGDIHQWHVWHGYAPWTDLTRSRAPFMSEFGLQALPDATTVAEMFADGPPCSLDDSRWVARKAQVAKLRFYAGPDADGNLSQVIVASQRVQATALQMGLEACRLRRESYGGQTEDPILARVSSAPERREIFPCGGVALWQFNEPWPAVSWSVIDRAGRPKAAYEMLRRSFQPVLIAARFHWREYHPREILQAEFWIANDGQESWHGCQASAALDGEILWSADGVGVEPATAQRIGELSWALASRPLVLSLCLSCGPAVLATNLYDLAVPLTGGQSWRGRLSRWLADRALGTG
jgi:beta-mannosidase